MVSDGDRDLWPDGILSPQIADFRLHCAESKVKPKMAERSGPGVKYGLEKVGKANITLKQKQEDILKIIALTQKDVFAVLNWLRKIVNISNNTTLDGLYDYMHSDQRPTQKKSIVFVVSSLNALIRDQVTKLKQSGLKACRRRRRKKRRTRRIGIQRTRKPQGVSVNFCSPGSPCRQQKCH